MLSKRQSAKLQLKKMEKKLNRVLAFDCSTNILAIALKDYDKLYIEVRDVGLMHSEKLMPLIDKIFLEAEIKATDLGLISCCKGPGSFTGLRIALATAKGISLAANVPLVSVLTTTLLESYSPCGKIVVPIIDAKKNRYYCALFYNHTPLCEPLDISLEDLEKLLEEKCALLKTKAIFFTAIDADKACSEFNELLKETNKSDKFELELDLNYKSSKIEKLIDLAIDEFKTRGGDDYSDGPLYIRKSEAEENLILRSKEN